MRLLKKLVSISSISGHESKLISYLSQYLSKLGFKPILLNGNLILHIKSEQQKNALIFNCHVDTVNPGDEKLWTEGPYSGKTKNGKLFGLGASDEKAAVATLLLIAEKFKNKIPKCDIWLTFVIKEELDGSGTKKFVDWFSQTQKYKNVAAVLGEPTDLLQIQIAHKGNMFIKITTKGDSGHGSEPEKLTKHAFKNMISIIQKIENLSKDWENQYFDNLLGKPTIGLTSLNGGNMASPNKFPDSCIATFDVRTTPTLHAKAYELLKQHLENEDCIIELLYDPAPYGYTEITSGIVKIAKKITKAKVGVSSSSNDLCFFTQNNIPGIVYGPGKHSAIHKPNEYCEIVNIKHCFSHYSEFIDSFSGV